jgi:hypothetical protein
MRTFVDAGVLIAAACGLPEIADLAFRVLDDPDRTLFTSDFVKLEVLPKPTFQGYLLAVGFLQHGLQKLDAGCDIVTKDQLS